MDYLPAPKAEQNVLVIMGALMLTMLLAALDQTIVSTALPKIAMDFDALNELSWVVTAYLITSAVATPLYGKLSDLFGDDATIDPHAAGGIEVSGLAVDSRAVKPGEVFFALAGAKTDGARFIDAAIAAGAVAIAGSHPPAGGCRVPFVTTPNPRRALALAAARFFSRQPATIAAVTGTSGKTSVAAFTRQIWQQLGFEAASIGTIGLVSPKRTVYGSLTTPDPIALHRQLDEIAREGVTHLAFEASSHGLDQYRLDGVRIAAGAFTNLSRDHLDYHPTIEAYLAA